MNLTFWQRIKRRISLWGGSYTHPNGTIELDFDEKAGIDPIHDSKEVQDAKFARYMEKQRDSSGGKRGLGAMAVAGAAVIFAQSHWSRRVGDIPSCGTHWNWASNLSHGAMVQLVNFPKTNMANARISLSLMICVAAFTIISASSSEGNLWFWVSLPF